MSRLGVVAVGLLGAGLVAAAAQQPVGDSATSEAEGRAEVLRDVPATANDLHAPRAHNSPVLAVDPTNADFVALADRLDDPDFSCALQLSGDGGQSWAAAEAVTALPEGVDHCYRPQVGFDTDGRLYYLFVGLGGRGNSPQGVWLTTSEDRGRTWARPWRLLGPNTYQVQLAVDRAAGEQGRLHLVWLSLGGAPTLTGLPSTPNPVMAAHSDDGGQTFTEPVRVSGSGRRRVVAPTVGVGADGRVHIVYYDLQGDARDYQGLPGPVWPGTWAVKAATSPDGGDSFADPVVVTDALQPHQRVMLIFTMPPPAIAADDQGHVYAGWADARHGDADILAAASTDHGRSWGQPVRVNDDEAGNGAVQWLPALAAAGNGQVDAVFLDRRADPGGAGQHTVYAASHDHGESFGVNRRLSTYPSDARSGPRLPVPTAQGHVEVGAGLALHASDSQTIAAWPDTRFAVPGTAQQEIYTATVRRPADGGLLSSWPAAAVGGLALAALVGLLVLGMAVRRRRAPRGRDAAAPEDDAPAHTKKATGQE